MTATGNNTEVRFGSDFNRTIQVTPTGHLILFAVARKSKVFVGALPPELRLLEITDQRELVKAFAKHLNAEDQEKPYTAYQIEIKVAKEISVDD